MGGSGATGAGSGAAANCRRRACASSSPLRDRLVPARLTSRRLGEGAGEPLMVAAKSFDGKLLTPSLLRGRFSGDGRAGTFSGDGRAGASCISVSITLCCRLLSYCTELERYWSDCPAYLHIKTR